MEMFEVLTIDGTRNDYARPAMWTTYFESFEYAMSFAQETIDEHAKHGSSVTVLVIDDPMMDSPHHSTYTELEQ